MAQNLVPNGSFEEYTTCPFNTGQIDRATGWTSFRSSPDYFNSCADITSAVSVPKNDAGFQYAADGDAYIGVITYEASAPNEENLEIVGAELATPLVAGYKYFVSFKVNMATIHRLAGNVASNKIGVSFSTSSFNWSNNPKPINNFAQVFSNNIIQDTANWITISGSFIADTAYRYIMLGNFFDTAHTDTIVVANDAPSPYYFSYYFIDDIRLSPDSSFVSDIQTISNKIDFSVYPNPAADFMTVSFNDNQLHQITLYNSVGEVMMTTSATKQNTINTAVFSKGVYFLKVNDYSSIKKLIIY